jgi:hypothetical protein
MDGGNYHPTLPSALSEAKDALAERTLSTGAGKVREGDDPDLRKLLELFEEAEVENSYEKREALKWQAYKIIMRLNTRPTPASLTGMEVERETFIAQGIGEVEQRVLARIYDNKTNRPKLDGAEA